MKGKERLDELIKFAEELKDDEGYAVVDVNLYDCDELYNPLSVGKNRDLSDDIYAFIDEQTNIIPAEVPLRIRFHGDIPKEEQDGIRQMMHRHYTMRSYDNLWDESVNRRKTLILSLLGVAILVVYFYFAFTSKPFFAELLSIIGSFAVWEAADSILLERPRLRREHRNILQNIKQLIEFIDDDPNQTKTLNSEERPDEEPSDAESEASEEKLSQTDI